jgi:hypothetical protein
MAAATKSGKKDAPKVNKREEAKARKEAEQKKVRDSKIKSGDLIVSGKQEFEKTGRSTKALERATKILSMLKKSKTPVLMSAIIEDLGSFYEDVLPALSMLESLGMVERFEARGNGRGRRSVAYLWIK